MIYKLEQQNRTPLGPLGVCTGTSKSVQHNLDLRLFATLPNFHSSQAQQSSFLVSATMFASRSIARHVRAVPKIGALRSSALILRANFSLDPKPDGSQEEKPAAKRIFDATYFQDLLNKNRMAIMAGGSVVTVVTVSNVLYAVGDNLLNLTASSALYYGFSVGAAATVCATVGAFLVEKSFRIEPETAVALTMAQVRKNKDLMNILGQKISPSEVKTYATSSSGFGVLGMVPKLVHPKIQITFNLVNSSSPAVVSAVFVKKGIFGQECEFVGVDWTTPAGASLNLTLVGEDSKFTMRHPFKEHAGRMVASRNSRL